MGYSMRLLSVNNQNQNPSFGYNKALNKKLVKLLSADGSSINKSLLKLNKLCNETEDLVTVQTRFRPSDSRGMYDEETETFLKVFVNLKLNLTHIVEERFPKLNFAREEASHYEKETYNDTLFWRREMIALLDKIADDKHQLFIYKK